MCLASVLRGLLHSALMHAVWFVLTPQVRVEGGLSARFGMHSPKSTSGAVRDKAALMDGRACILCLRGFPLVSLRVYHLLELLSEQPRRDPG